MTSPAPNGCRMCDQSRDLGSSPGWWLPNSGLILVSDGGFVGWRAQDFVGPVPVPLVLPLFPARVTFSLLPLLPEFPDPSLPPPELVQWTTPFVPSGVVVGVQEPGAGGVGGPLVDETRVSERRTGRIRYLRRGCRGVAGPPGEKPPVGHGGHNVLPVIEHEGDPCHP